MGLLDDMENKALASLLGGSSNPLAASVLQMISNHPGGLPGLLQSFHDKGLGDIVSSWVGTGQNLPISAEQVQHVLGSDQIKALASKAGISPDIAGSSLAQFLPMLIDKLTPNGQVPPQASLLETGMSLLKSLGRTGTEG
ncbi:MAG TPA: YidB family protein [Terriglobales bacterium]|nr:YidB family protein [Terriglobales bacterium]